MWMDRITVRDCFRGIMLMAALILSVDVVHDISAEAASGLTEVVLVCLALAFMYRSRRQADQRAPVTKAADNDVDAPRKSGTCARHHLVEHFAKHSGLQRAQKRQLVQHTFVKSRVFVASGFVEQVSELLEQLEPTKRCYEIMNKVRDKIHAEIQPHCPGVDIRAYLHSDITECTAYASAVPEMELAVFADVSELASWVLPHGDSYHQEKNPEKVSKHLLRHLTKALVFKCYSDGLRHCRSFYCAAERRLQVTLALMNADEFNQKVAFDFSVNWSLPAQHSAIVDFCAQQDPGATGLIRLVRRWSKDRGICFAPHGHLGPFAWTTLVLFFLQVQHRRLSDLRFQQRRDGRCEVRCANSSSEGSSIKDFEGYEGDNDKTRKMALAEDVCQLFKDFLCFYSGFGFTTQVIDVNRHHALRDDKFSATIVIVDPFDSSRNLGANVTQVGLARLEAEFARARDILKSDTPTLSTILELWVGIGTTRRERSTNGM